MSSKCGFLFPILLGSILVPMAQGETPVFFEWKMRATESLRNRIAQERPNPFIAHVESSTPETAQPADTVENTLPILSSLTHFLTQAATETVSFSREIRPSIEWPKRLWRSGESEEWSWRERFNWFQNEQRNQVDSASAEIRNSTDEVLPGAIPNAEGSETEVER